MKQNIVKHIFSMFRQLMIFDLNLPAFFCLLGLTSIFSFAQPLAQGQNTFLGNCLDNTIYSNFDDYWNQVTPGNAGKWGSVEYTQDYYNWIQLDNIYNYAQSNGLLYKHHTLIWGQQQPAWISGLDSAAQREQVEEWIQLVGERYPNIDYIDVVNEPFHAPPSYKQALGGDGKTGFDWIITAFEWARQYCDSSAKLLINEYNVLHDNTQTNNYLRLIDTLKARDLIDGVAVQGHYFEFKGSGYTWSITTIKNNLNKLIATGLPFYLSEFDINEADDDTQLQNYMTYFPIFWENPGVKGITLWGYVQYDIWKVDAYLLTDPRFNERPAMEWLRTYILSPFPPVLISPLKTIDEPLNTILTWQASDSADAYHIQISTLSSFSSTFVDTTISDTLVQIYSLASDTRYYWRASALNEHGESRFTSTTYFITVDTATALSAPNVIPSDFVLYQNYPNPFNPETKIKYSLDKSTKVNLGIYNIFGQKVRSLVQQSQSSGLYQVVWDGRNESGNLMPTGTYFYKLETNDKIQIRKMLLMK